MHNRLSPATQFIRTQFRQCLFIAITMISNPAFSSSEAPSSSLQTDSQDTLAIDIDDIHHFISTLAQVKHHYLTEISTKELINHAIEGMVGSLDPHSSYMNAQFFEQLQNSISGEFGGIGVEIVQDQGVIKIISPIEDGPAHKAGIKPNDLIVRIDNALVQDLGTDKALQRIRGKRGTQVHLTIIRKGANKPLNIMVKRDVIKVKSVKSQLYDNKYGYIQLMSFQKNGKQAIVNAISTLHEQSKHPLQGLIIDLRNNPGGLLHVAIEIADLFLDPNDLKHNKLIVFTKGKNPESNLNATATEGEMLEGVPIVVLMNQGSASASEVVAGALQDHKRAIIVGRRSFGKGSVQTIIPTLDGNGALKLTTALYFTPSGRSIQAKGISPDLVVSDIQLPDKKTEAVAFVPVSEKDLEGHLIAPKKSRELNTINGYENLALAKKDYQLYQALNILKGLAVLTQHQQS